MKTEQQRATITDPTDGSRDQASETGASVALPDATKTAPSRGNIRALPASVLTPPAPAPSPRLDDYRDIIGQAQVDALRFLARDLKGKSIKMVNSTAVGGAPRC